MLDNPKQFLQSVPNKPGVYQMLDANRKTLYVGKAKNLKKRLTSYFLLLKDQKTSAFMEKVKNIEIIITANENSALLLEYNLIKNLKPRYNILFKDDKSFQYICFSDHEFPRLGICRKNKKISGKFFGPFPNAKAVGFALKLLQKIFQLRVCSDSCFKNHSCRPCMLYQLKLCGGACAGYIDQSGYQENVEFACQFLSNKNTQVVQKLTSLMDNASGKLDYEQAAKYRDQIIKIRHVQSQQAIIKGDGSYDIIAVAGNNTGVICVDVMFVRNGLLLGNKPYFSTFNIDNFDNSCPDILTSFIMQHYLQRDFLGDIPDRIITNIKLPNQSYLNCFLESRFKKKIVLADGSKRGSVKQLVAMAYENAVNALRTSGANFIDYSERLLKLKETLNLVSLPQQIECFDISHMMGEATVASCVVFNEKGPDKANYRKFNINSVKPGDDYGALFEAVFRRYRGLHHLPDLIIIDGGRGQLNIVSKILQKLHLNIEIIGVAKGLKRRVGLEKIYVGKKSPLILLPQDPCLHFIQQIRDEAHRFAISGHRKQLIRSRKQSVLDNISGIGKSKKINLLKHFGGLEELKNANIEEIAEVKNISKKLAVSIYEYLHNIN